MKNWYVALLLLPALISCSNMKKSDNFYHVIQENQGEVDSYNLPKHAINDVVKGLAYQMLNSSSFVTPKTPVAVASFVDLKNLDETDWLGNQLEESFVHELQLHGLVVIDYKMTGSIRVTPEGDFVFSRDWQELPKRQVIDYIVAGTMQQQDGGVMVNARMVGVQSHVVVASSQAFIPGWVLGDSLVEEQNVRMKDGMIIREQATLIEEPRAVEIH